MKPIYFFSFIIILITACDREEQGPEPSDLEGIFEKVWTDFDRQYPYFHVKGIDWDSVYTENRSKIVNGSSSNAELAAVLSQMLIGLKDLHVGFETNFQQYRYQIDNEQLEITAGNYFSRRILNNQFLEIGLLEDDQIVYCRVKNLNGQGDFKPLYEIDRYLDDRNILIIDLRNNGGGNNAIAKRFVNMLVREPHLYMKVRTRNGPHWDDFTSWTNARLEPTDEFSYSGKIYVLINNGVYSAAESFTLMLRSLPNTMLIGDTTGGSSGNPQEYNLSNGWSYRISTWQLADEKEQLIEDRGIAPDIYVEHKNDSMNDDDLILEKAIELALQ